jgi:hypothetical protein
MFDTKQFLKWLSAVGGAAVVILVVLAAGLGAQEAVPTTEEVAAEMAALLVTGLGLIGTALMQVVKRLLVPLDRAPAYVKGIVTLLWGVGLSGLAGVVPWLAAALPGDPSLLGTAINGVMLAAVMAGLHSFKKIIERPEATGLPS